MDWSTAPLGIRIATATGGVLACLALLGFLRRALALRQLRRQADAGDGPYRSVDRAGPGALPLDLARREAIAQAVLRRDRWIAVAIAISGVTGVPYLAPPRSTVVDTAAVAKPQPVRRPFVARVFTSDGRVLRRWERTAREKPFQVVREVPGGIRALAVDGDDLFAWHASGHLVRYDPKLREVARTRVPVRALYEPWALAASEGLLAVGLDHRVRVVDGDLEEVAVVPAGGDHVFIRDGSLYVAAVRPEPCPAVRHRGVWHSPSGCMAARTRSYALDGPRRHLGPTLSLASAPGPVDLHHFVDRGRHLVIWSAQGELHARYRYGRHGGELRATVADGMGGRILAITPDGPAWAVMRRGERFYLVDVEAPLSERVVAVAGRRVVDLGVGTHLSDAPVRVGEKPLGVRAERRGREVVVALGQALIVVDVADEPIVRVVQRTGAPIAAIAVERPRLPVERLASLR